MKCPKCAYVSFDHNDACPKCGNALGAERDEMNLPSFKPSPPFLLDSLLEDEDATMKMAENQEAEGFSPDQEELVANLDQLALAYKEPEHPQEEAFVFSATEETPEAEEIGRELGPHSSEKKELTFDISAEQPETEAFEDASGPEPQFPDLDTLEFDIDSDQSEIDAIDIDDGFEIPEEGQKEVQSESEVTGAERRKSEPDEFEASDTEIEFELDKALKESEARGDSAWDTGAIEKKNSEVEEQVVILDETDASPHKKSDGDSEEFIIELDEIEPLEMDLETEASDKKDIE